MKPILQIHLLGPFELVREGRALTNSDWRSQQTRTICKIMLVRRGQVVTSDQIIEILWPDELPDAARRRLHVRVSQLRKALGNGKSLVQTVDGGYLFNPDGLCWLDVDEFQAAVEAGARFQEAGQQTEAVRAYERARKCYRGDFLAEDLYADWTYAMREFYRERFLTLLIELSECYAQQGRYRLAIARCQEALARDPLRETIYVRLMLYHYYAGERAQSLEVFERCREILATELAVDPLEATTHLSDQIRTGTLWTNPDSPRYPPPIYEGRLFKVPYALSETPLVGRDREYAWLVAAWQNDDQRVILLEGEAGIGKTRLLNEFIGYITARGADVLRSRISPGVHVPFGPVVAALQHLIAPEPLSLLPPQSLAALALIFPAILDMGITLPSLPVLPPLAERTRLYEAVNTLIASSVPRQTLLVVDDAHRMDPATCEMLARMTNVVKILLSYRSEETPTDHPLHKVFLAALDTPATLHLSPLTASDVEELIDKLAYNDLPGIAAEIKHQTDGNPFHVVALLQHMFEEGHLYINADGDWSTTNHEAASLPPTIRKTIEARLRRLNRSQRKVFDIAAVLGGEFDFVLLQQASKQPEETLLTTLDELIDVALIVEPRSTERAEFTITHDYYTEAAYDTLPAVRRRQLHRLAGAAIEMVYAGTLNLHYPSLADQFGKAGITEKERHYAALAGEQAAAQFSNAVAIRYLSRSLELTPSINFSQRYRLLLTREKVYDLLGDRQSQKINLEALASLAENLTTRQQAKIHLRQAAYDWIVGDDSAARANIEKSIALAQSCGATDLEAACYLQRGRAALNQDLARQDLEKGRILAQKDELRALEGDLVRCLGNAFFWQNSYRESQAHFEEALAIHREVGDRRGELSALNNLGHLHQLLGAPKIAVDYYKKGLKICHKIGDRLAEGVLLGNLGALTALLGNYPQAQIWLEQACEIRDAIENEEGVGTVLMQLGDVFRQKGKYATAKTHYERALAINTRIRHAEQLCGTLDSLSLLHRELGDFACAQDYFQRALSVQEDDTSPNRIRALANGCLLHHMIGDNKHALEIGLRTGELSQNLHPIQATILTNLGHVLVALNQFEAAREKYQQALELRHKLMQTHLAIEPLAGLMKLDLEVNCPSDAYERIDEILIHLGSGPFEGPDQPMRIYWTCYQVLAVNEDQRALEILGAAYHLLHQRAATIEDASLRRSYLENVIPHQEIVLHFEKFQ